MILGGLGLCVIVLFYILEVANDVHSPRYTPLDALSAPIGLADTSRWSCRVISVSCPSASDRNSLAFHILGGLLQTKARELFLLSICAAMHHPPAVIPGSRTVIRTKVTADGAWRWMAHSEAYVEQLRGTRGQQSVV